MATSPDPGPRVYRGLNHREGIGWIAGMTPVQAFGLIGVCAPALIAMSRNQWSAALSWAVVAAIVAVLIVVPIRGRPAFRWCADLVMFQTGVFMGWSLWQSRAAAGLAGDPGEPDLPGVLARLEFPDGPELRGTRICLIHDTAEGRWGATATLTHSGVGMLSDDQCERLAARLGSMLVGLGHREVVDRVSLCVRTVPDDGTEYTVWRERHQRRDAPALARRVTAEIDSDVASVSVRTELFVTVSGTEDALRRPAKAAGGGIAGRAYALYRVLEGVADGLRGLGVTSVTWLSSTGVAEAIKTGFNPAAAAGLSHRHLTNPAPDPDGGQPGSSTVGLPISQAGPALSPTPAARAYHHDGYSSVAYAVQPPESGTIFGALGPLLAVRTAGERRTLAVHYEILSAAAGARVVKSDRFRNNVLVDAKAARGFTTTAIDTRRQRGARDQEAAVAAGHAVIRYTVAAAITVPAGWNVEDHAARLENDASGRFRLLRLELAQDSAFVAAALPVGIGLPRQKRTFDT
ncbi:putative integral membrane protein [Pseudonocardia sp. Ae717_Ps2]|uniref:SCO6880 family protein n=1 Tax=Pseudonocardia sp. Ae717_Ps2 TaxID=1885573 RepID=UPI00094B7457|nr:SCO6880 family protein [Pseudonocardia sp. Ae717_Ps2]OLM28976.1 putative integral membrane protein [Pseudonocardia sp. Ae717_Ps2]